MGLEKATEEIFAYCRSNRLPLKGEPMFETPGNDGRMRRSPNIIFRFS